MPSLYMVVIYIFNAIIIYDPYIYWLLVTYVPSISYGGVVIVHIVVGSLSRICKPILIPTKFLIYIVIKA